MITRLLIVPLAAGAVVLGYASAALAAPSPLLAPFNLPPPQSSGKQSSCETPPAPVVTLAAESIYEEGDPTHSEIDPAAKDRYEAAVAPLRDFTQNIAKMASRYVRSGGRDTASANCVIAWLDSWAAGGALQQLVTKQAALSATRILSGLALAYVEVRGASGTSSPKKTEIEQWFAGLARQTMGVFGDTGHTSLGNHRYWGGLAVGAIAIATGDRQMFDWAMDSYRLGICQVDDAGALPIELTRGKRARDYHIHASAPLVMLAEMGARNGLDTYGECGGAIHRLVKFVLTAVKDPSVIEPLAGAKQVELADLDSRLAWVAIYRSRFPLPIDIDLPKSLDASPLGGDLDLLYGD